MSSARTASAPLALIAAGGSGERLGAGGPKALVECAGKSLLTWCLEAFLESETIERVAVAIVESARDDFEDAIAPLRTAGLEVLVTRGGPSRSHSVRAAYSAALTDAAGAWPSAVLVHDAARPLVSPVLIDACVSQVSDADVDAVVPAAQVVDTIKLADDEHLVESTPDRSRLWAVQTPQAFDGRALGRVLGLDPQIAPVDDALIAAATDDASLIEAAGGRVKILPWTAVNPKVTTATDLAAVERLLAATV
ncbi:MAG: IspD/TarI family cytidylyltransferase [Solirubrobacterales bacterium]